MPRVHRYITVFNKRSDERLTQYPLRGVRLSQLRRLFGADKHDPMYDCFPVGPTQAKEVAHWTGKPLNPGKYDYFLECEA